MLRQAAEWARAETGPFVGAVLDGLDLGAKRYGETDYEGRDNAEGGLFECRDLAAYSLMDYADMDNDLAAGADREAVEDARMFLGRALRAAAEADQCLRSARALRSEARRDARLAPLTRQTKGVAP